MKLSRYLRLEGQKPASDGGGGQTFSWVDLGGHWAEVTPRTGSEITGPLGAKSKLSLTIVTHFLPEGHPNRPEAGHRFREGNRLYAIHSVAEGTLPGAPLRITATQESHT